MSISSKHRLHIKSVGVCTWGCVREGMGLKARQHLWLFAETFKHDVLKLSTQPHPAVEHHGNLY